MNKLNSLFYSLFGIGFCLKFFHIHYNAIFMLVALGGLLITNIVYLFNQQKRFDATVHIGIFSWLAFLLIVIKFFPVDKFAIVLAIVLSVVVTVMVVKKQQFKKLIFLGLCAALALTFYAIPSDSRYYMLNVKWNYEIDRDFITLDKYSWLLYKNGNVDKALQTSEQALEIAKKSEQAEWINIIENHKKQIQLNDWQSYH